MEEVIGQISMIRCMNAARIIEECWQYLSPHDRAILGAKLYAMAAPPREPVLLSNILEVLKREPPTSTESRVKVRGEDLLKEAEERRKAEESGEDAPQVEISAVV